MNIRIRPFLLAALLLTLAIFPYFASANHAWGNYHWARSANPVHLDVGNNMTTKAWSDHLGGAVADWNQSAVLDLSLATGQAKGKCRPNDGRIEVCNDSYGNTGWLGVAQIWASGDHITQGTAKMNDTYFLSSTYGYNTSEWRQLVVCQEVGHLFGLDHQDENFDNPNLGTCMDYTSDPSTNQHPNKHDYDELALIYSHLDDSSSGGGGGGCNPHSPKCNSNNGVAGSDFNAPGEWGRLVRSQGRAAVYERDFGNGFRLVTFVIWA